MINMANCTFEATPVSDWGYGLEFRSHTNIYMWLLPLKHRGKSPSSISVLSKDSLDRVGSPLGVEGISTRPYERSDGS